MTIEQDIAAWDGKSAADIKAVYDAHHAETSFVRSIVDLSFVPTCGRGATWLLKAWLEAGNILGESQAGRIYSSLSQLKHWGAKLHILQSIPFIPISESASGNVYNFLRRTLTDKNKFVRAWSYSGFYELSKQHPKYLNEAKQYFEMAKRDEAPSVKARIRNIMKRGF